MKATAFACRLKHGAEHNKQPWNLHCKSQLGALT